MILQRLNIIEISPDQSVRVYERLSDHSLCPGVGCSKRTCEVADALLLSLQRKRYGAGATFLPLLSLRTFIRSHPVLFLLYYSGVCGCSSNAMFTPVVRNHVNSLRTSLIRKIKCTLSQFLAATHAALCAFSNLAAMRRRVLYLPALKTSISSYILIRVELITHICLLT